MRDDGGNGGAEAIRVNGRGRRSLRRTLIDA
jgi:hypothetical protein